ncbi:MAG TPA: dolichol kinase [Bacteroidetes bacterium]|jgi:dolichol kinase|nr:dolichol kinase [Bacteroidota bacterium]
MNNLPDVERDYSGELARKAIHLSSLSIPIVYCFFPKSTVLAILVPLALLFGVTDIARHLFPAFRQFYHRLFGWLMRAHEKDEKEKRLTGATYVLLSAVIGILIFPKVIIITAFAIMIVSDTVAALFGRKFGRHPFLRKSLEGTLAFFVSAVVVVCFAPKVGYVPAEYLVGFVAAFIGSVVEAMSIAIDDNLSITFSIGGVMWLMYALLLPTLNVYALDFPG